MPDAAPALPAARGPLSDAVITALRREPGRVALPPVDATEILGDDDAQLALWCCYELHYASFAGVDDDWEWEPGLLSVRRRLEAAFEEELTDAIGPPRPTRPGAVLDGLRELTRGDGPSLSRHVLHHATSAQLREFLVHRSAYQLKEADPHTWAIPRLRGRAKTAMVAIQHDEYGEGDASAMHAELFAITMRSLGLDPTFGAYVDLLPGTTLATDNLPTLFGLHRRWRAACVGHLALFEMTSIQPMRRYSEALARYGADSAARRFYDVHVVADAWHEHLAQQEMVVGLLEQDERLGGTVLFGARALAHVEARFAERLLQSWARGRPALLGESAFDHASGLDRGAVLTR